MRASYEERLTRFREGRRVERSLSHRLGWIRLVVFLVGFSLYVVWDATSGTVAVWAGGGMGVALLAFLVLVAWHRRVRARERRYRMLAEINEVALSRLDRDWSALPPTPLRETSAEHPFALDLDICGEASLFRLLTTITLPPGLRTMRSWLLEPTSSGEILRRQEAVEELAPRVDLRQDIEATGRLSECPDPESIADFLAWAEEDPWLPGHPWLVLGAWVLPVLSATLVGLQLWGMVPGPWWFFTLSGAFLLASTHRTRIHALMEPSSGGQARFGRYAALLTLLLEMEVTAPALSELQRAVRSSPVGAAHELRRLGRRVAWADIRFSEMAHVPLQALFAWDIHILWILERWKRRSGRHVRGWLEALGHLEALAALSTLKADHPEWCFPTFHSEGLPRLRARDLGHPLLPTVGCVANDVEVGPPGSFLFVTGSNMSGKSTLLRAVGINVVLAQAGAPVCAREMSLTPVAVHTSMRTADSLSQGVSQYMAELKRIQQVVMGARAQGETAVLYLLDEPLQGTNEAERRVAVQTILGHLLDAGSIGAVATHDLQLDGVPRLAEAANPVHLEGQVREGEEGPLITFDYRLRQGRATSTNALALLRAVGLGEVSEDPTGGSGGPAAGPPSGPPAGPLS